MPHRSSDVPRQRTVVDTPARSDGGRDVRAARGIPSVAVLEPGANLSGDPNQHRCNLHSTRLLDWFRNERHTTNGGSEVCFEQSIVWDAITKR